MVWNNLVPTVDTGTTLSTKLNAWAASVETRLSGASHYVGAKDVTAPIGAFTPTVGDYIFVNKKGTVDASWTGAAGQPADVQDAMFFDGTNWDLIPTKSDLLSDVPEVFADITAAKAAVVADGTLVRVPSLDNTEYVVEPSTYKETTDDFVMGSGQKLRRLYGGGFSSKTDIFIIYGQSNAKGTAPDETGKVDRIDGRARMWNGTAIVPLTVSMPTANDGNSTGGAWSSFANEYCEKTGRSAVFLNCAKGSQAISDLSKGDPSGNYTDMINFYNAAKAALTAEGKTGETYFVFHQGEQDQTKKTSYSDYLTALKTLWSDVKADALADRMFLYVFGTYLSSATPYGNPIKSAQRMFASETNDVIIASSKLESFSQDNGLRSGAAHYTQAGYNLMGLWGAKTVVEYLRNNNQESSDFLDDYGSLSLEKGLNYQVATAVVKKQSGNFSISNTTLNGSSGIVEIDETNPTILKIKLPQPATRVVSSQITTGLAGAERGLIAAVGDIAKLSETATSEIPISFLYSPTIRVKFGAQTIDVSASGSNYNSSTLTAFSPTWGTGVLTLTHPSTSKLAVGVIRDTVSTGLKVSSGTTSTTVECYNGGITNYDGEVALKFDSLVLPIANVPQDFEFSVTVIYATYRQ